MLYTFEYKDIDIEWGPWDVCPLANLTLTVESSDGQRFQVVNIEADIFNPDTSLLHKQGLELDVDQYWPGLSHLTDEIHRDIAEADQAYAEYLGECAMDLAMEEGDF